MLVSGAESKTVQEMYDALHLDKSSNFLQGYKDLAGYLNVIFLFFL